MLASNFSSSQYHSTLSSREEPEKQVEGGEATLSENLAIRILKHAQENKYGVPGVLAYNLETIVACVQAATNKNSPCQILLFPWAMKYTQGAPLLVNLAWEACRSAAVPMSLHLDHAQTESEIKTAASTGKFDSIMVDMSHHSKSENLRLTKQLTEYCHSLGISTEAEPGRINGGEAGIQHTPEDLEEILTTPEEAKQFADTGIDFLAPAIGNVHGAYNGVENIRLDYERLEGIRDAVTTTGTVTKDPTKNVLLVMHGTNEFTEDILKRCVQGGITRMNVNDLVVCGFHEYRRSEEGRSANLTDFMEEGTKRIRERIEWLMDVLGSTGRAADFR